MQRGASGANAGEIVDALDSHRKALQIFSSLARLLPDNAQAQRDLSTHDEKTLPLELLAGGQGRGAEPEPTSAINDVANFWCFFWYCFCAYTAVRMYPKAAASASE